MTVALAVSVLEGPICGVTAGAVSAVLCGLFLGITVFSIVI